MSLNAAGQDLRDRSFRGQHLDGADFRGADLRGCDFSGASLRRADFRQVRLGVTPRQVIRVLLVAGGVAGLLADALSHLVFGALGRTPAEAGWAFVVALYLSVGVAGLGMAYGLAKPVAQVVTGGLAGALVGFFWGGSLTQNNPAIAVAIASIVGGVLAIASYRQRHPLGQMAIAIARALTGYAFAFLVWAWALAWLTTGHWLLGGALTGLTVLYGGWSVQAVAQAVRYLQGAIGTRFHQADLTDACFDPIGQRM